MNTCIIAVLFSDYHSRPYGHLYYCCIIIILPLAVPRTPVLLLYYLHITTRGPMNTCIIAVLFSDYHSRPYEHLSLGHYPRTPCNAVPTMQSINHHHCGNVTTGRFSLVLCNHVIVFIRSMTYRTSHHYLFQLRAAKMYTREKLKHGC